MRHKFVQWSANDIHNVTMFWASFIHYPIYAFSRIPRVVGLNQNSGLAVPVHVARHDPSHCNVFSGFLMRTGPSSLLSETVKERRVLVCMQAVDTLEYPFPHYDFLRKGFTDMNGMLRSVQMERLVRSRCHSSVMILLYVHKRYSLASSQGYRNAITVGRHSL
jgi:hypothetical protein